MRRGVLIVSLALLLIAASGAAAAQPAQRGESSGPSNKTEDERALTGDGSWIACAVLGTYHYVRYLLDSSNGLRLVYLSEYLERGNCFWRDLERAAEIYRAGAKAGEEAHALYLGFLYLKGLGVDRDVKEARRWFGWGVLYQLLTHKKEQIRRTQRIMGPRGIPPELMNAIDERRQLMQGDGEEILRLAKWLRKGIHGMTQNKEAAAKLANIASFASERLFPTRLQAEFQRSRTMLENSYQTRDPYQRMREFRKSFGWIYNRASAHNHPPSQRIAAEIFEAGEMVKKDLVIAYFFLLSAQKNGLDVTEEIERILPQMTPEQISEAESDIRQGNSRKYLNQDIRKERLLPLQ